MLRVRGGVALDAATRFWAMRHDEFPVAALLLNDLAQLDVRVRRGLPLTTVGSELLALLKLRTAGGDSVGVETLPQFGAALRIVCLQIAITLLDGGAEGHDAALIEAHTHCDAAGRAVIAGVLLLVGDARRCALRRAQRATPADVALAAAQTHCIGLQCVLLRRNLAARVRFAPRAPGRAPVEPRAATSATLDSAPSATSATVAFWNSAGLAAAPNSTAARSKLDWLDGLLTDQAPDVVYLFEVIGAMPAFRVMRRWLSRRGYDCRFLPGQSERQHDGVVVAARSARVRILSYRRVARRALGVKLQWRGDADERVVVGMHGLAGDAVSERHFAVQLRLCMQWIGSGGLLVGDFNHVACSAWRAQTLPLSRGDRAIRLAAGYRCDCCALDADGVTRTGALVCGECCDEGSGFTRYETRDGSWGDPTSYIDYAIAVASAWRRVASIAPELVVSGGATVVSDHFAQIVDTALPIACATRPTRPVALRFGHSPAGRTAHAIVSEALCDRSSTAALISRDVAAARMGGACAADAAVALAVEALAEVHDARRYELRLARNAKRGPRGGLADPKCRFFMWKQRLGQARAARRCGLAAWAANHLALLHPKTGLRRYICREGDGWGVIIRRCRHEMCFAARVLHLRQDAEAKDAERLAKRWHELPEDDAVGRMSLAYRIARGPRASVTMEHVHVADDAAQQRLHCTEQQASGVMADIGARMVAGYDSGSVPDAYQAMCDKFVGQWPVLRGRSGGDWCLADELTYPIFCEVVARMPDKAVGVSGFAVALLKRAGRTVKRAFYRAILDDATSGVVSSRWHTVLYVLLVKKPPNREAIIRERREIALTEQDVKALLQAVRRLSYARLLGRVAKMQVGWVPGLSCTDPGMASGWLAQQARRLQQSIYFLFVDLSQFFPRVCRTCLRVGDVAHGLPDEVVELALAIYGLNADDPRVAQCRYDSVGGLSDGFPNGMGTLMGCPLSTDEARIFLNCLVLAIHAVGRGVRLWGASTDDGAWRRVLQLLCADDWLGACSSEQELQDVWAVWKMWEPISNCKLGIDNSSRPADKTVVTGVLRDDDGRERDIDDPRLRTVDGRPVPIRSRQFAYKHLGRWRCADGTNMRGRVAFDASFRDAVRKLRRLRRVSTRTFMLVSDALIGGSAGFHLQETFLTFKEADALEARWRRVFNRVAHRDSSTPRAEIYARRIKPGVTRRHLWTHGLVALYNAVNASLCDAEDTEHRAAARSGLALTMHKWGCRQDPRTWDWAHLRPQLEAALAAKRARFIGDAWMLAVLELREAPQSNVGTEDDDDANDNGEWRQQAWIWPDDAPPGPHDPLSPLAAHWAPPASAMLCSLGIQVDFALLSKGYVACGHFSEPAPGGGVRWAKFDSAVRRDRSLRKSAPLRRAWAHCRRELILAKVVPPPRAAADAAEAHMRQGRHLFAPLDGASRGATVDLAAMHQLADDLQRARVRKPAVPLAAGVDYWRRRLDSCIAADRPVQREWCHGVTGYSTRAHGAHLVFDLERRTARDADGGDARWLARDDVDGEGCAVDWREVADGWIASYDIDHEGFVVCDGVRVAEQNLGMHAPAIQLVARARYLLPADAPVVEHPITKDHKSEQTRVNLTAARRSLEAAIVAQARYRFTHAVASDATKATKTSQAGNEYTVVARAAVFHDGEVVAGQLRDAEPYLGVHDTTYLAEKAATDDAIATLPQGARVLCWIDSTSHLHSLRSFLRAPARRKRQVHAAGRFASTEALLRLPEVVMFHWQMSHVGDPTSEAADLAADRAAEEEVPLPVQPSRTPFATMLFPRNSHSERQWSGVCLDEVVAARMRATVVNTHLREPDDIVPRGLAAADRELLQRVLAERCFHSDAGQKISDGTRERRATHTTCPWCAASACTWQHFCFECPEQELVEHRLAAADKLASVKVTLDAAAPHADVAGVLEWLRHGTPGGRFHAPPAIAVGSPLAVSSGRLARARRVVGGLIDPHGVTVSVALRANIGAFLSSCAALFRCALEECDHKWGVDLRLMALAERVGARYLRKLQRRAQVGGPARAAALRECGDLDARAYAAFHEGGYDGDVVAWERLRIQYWATIHSQQQAVEIRGVRWRDSVLRRPWWALARLQRWRLRAWQRAGLTQVDLPPAVADAHAAALIGGTVPLARLTIEELRARARLAEDHAARERALRSPRAGARRGAVVRRSRALATWAATGSVSGAPLGAVGVHIDISVGGRRRSRAGAARRARESYNRRVASGQSHDAQQAWSTVGVRDVRSLGRGSALEALVEWQGDHPPSWVRVNRAWMPGHGGALLAREARRMYAARRAQEAAARPPPRARRVAPVPSTSAARVLRSATRPMEVESADVSLDDDLAQLLAARRARAVDDAHTRAQVQSEMSAAMDTGIRVNPALEAALGARGDERSAASRSRSRDGSPEPAVSSGEDDGSDDSDDSDDSGSDSGSSDEGEAAHVPAAVEPRVAAAQARGEAAYELASLCGLRSASGGADSDLRHRLRRSVLEVRRTEQLFTRAGGTAATPVRAGYSVVDGVCRVCGGEVHGALCARCILPVLGHNAATAPAQRVAELCARPSLAALAQVLVDSDVRGDGSCWSYAALAPFGLCPHICDGAGRPLAITRPHRLGGGRTSCTLAPRNLDTLHDAHLRGAVAKWQRSNDGAARNYGDHDLGCVRIARKEHLLPSHDRASGAQRLQGAFGGDAELPAIADLTGCVFFSVLHDAGDGDEVGTRYEPGVFTVDGRRSRAVSSTLSAALEFCLVARLRMIILRYHPLHWHVLLPTDPQHRLVCAALPPALSLSDDDVNSAMLHALVVDMCRDVAAEAQATYDVASAMLHALAVDMCRDVAGEALAAPLDLPL